MENVKEIKSELGGTERKLAEGLGHSREIGRLLGLVELVGRFIFGLLRDLTISGSGCEGRAAEGNRGEIGAHLSQVSVDACRR